jgi:hypothetical protein
MHKQCEKKEGPLGDVHLLLDSLTHEPDDGKTPGAAQVSRLIFTTS